MYTIFIFLFFVFFIVSTFKYKYYNINRIVSRVIKISKNKYDVRNKITKTMEDFNVYSDIRNYDHQNINNFLSCIYKHISLANLKIRNYDYKNNLQNILSYFISLTNLKTALITTNAIATAAAPESPKTTTSHQLCCANDDDDLNDDGGRDSTNDTNVNLNHKDGGKTEFRNIDLTKVDSKKIRWCLFLQSPFRNCIKIELQ